MSTSMKIAMSDEILRQVTYLIGKEIEEGRHEPLAPDYVAAVLHISVEEAEEALSKL